tara:strand:- start:1531 stop:1908 length:378 start_codon:yes stop_codon:yes gene_type:complete
MEELTKENLKVIRLENGEILFAKVEVTDRSKSNGYLELHWPMKVMMKFNDDKKETQLALLKWLPFTDTTHVPLSARSIMSVSELGKEFQDFYINSVEEDRVLDRDQELDKMSKILADYEPKGLMN